MRSAVGLSAGRWRPTLHTQLVLDALKMALWQRRPNSVIHHWDQGSQYTSIESGNLCRQAGVRPSMGSVGDAYDNAMAESFFATLECEIERFDDDKGDCTLGSFARRPDRNW